MRTTQQRVSAVQSRVTELKRRDRIIKETVSIAAVLVLVLGVTAIPRMTAPQRSSPEQVVIQEADVPLAAFVAAPSEVSVDVDGDTITATWPSVDGADDYAVTLYLDGEALDSQTVAATKYAIHVSQPGEYIVGVQTCCGSALSVEKQAEPLRFP